MLNNIVTKAENLWLLKENSYQGTKYQMNINLTLY